MIEYKKFNQVVSENRKGVNFEDILQGKNSSIRFSMNAMENLLRDRKIKDILAKQAPGLLKNSPWVNSGFGLYFATVANMKTTFAPRALPTINTNYNTSWKNPIELGSGVGFIEPWEGAKQLLQLGTDSSELMVNYDSPGGRYPARWAVATILNAQVGIENALREPIFTFKDTYITPSSTAAIDTVFEAFSKMAEEEKSDRNRIVILGPSYYVLALSAQSKNLPVTRITEPSDKSFGIRTFFPSVEQLETELPSDTGMIVITLPNNPNGESIENNQLESLFKLAKSRGILILVDQLFEQLYFEEDLSKKPNPTKIAKQTDSLEQLVIVDALSKSQNLAGIRLGWLATKNQQLERNVNKISITRLSNPSLTIEPLLQFEALARIIDRQIPKSSLLKESNFSKKAWLDLAIELAINNLEKISGNGWLENVSRVKLAIWYEQRIKWLSETAKYYSENLSLIQYLLDESNQKIIRSPDLAAYNTFIGFGETKQNAGFDKILKLFLLTGIVAMSGQCFGQVNPSDEFWTRITYGGISRDRISEAMFRLIGFLNLWDELQLGESDKYPTINTDFKII